MKAREINILITGTGGPTPRSFARALRRGEYARYRLFGTDIHKYAIGLYQNDVFEKSFLTPKSPESDYWPSLEAIIKENDIEIAIIQPETEVKTWSQRQSSGKLPCKALVPDIRCVDVMMDKASLSELLCEAGLVPETVSFGHDEKDLEHLITTRLKYPFWVRSSTGSSGLGSLKVHSFADLERWMNLNPLVERFIASNYLAGRNLACKLLYYDDKLVRAAVGERVNYIMAKVAPSGVTGNTSFGRLLNDPAVFECARKAIEIVFKKTNARKHGFFTVDLKEDATGRKYITEINIRHVAFTEIFAMAGANLCEDSVRLLDGDSKFDSDFHLYNFPDDYVFLREVDSLPILLREKDLL